MNVAYFTTMYPAVTHTFIRREIRAIETLGVKVFRFAVRWGENLVDTEDIKEKAQTRYIAKVSVLELLRACLGTLLTRPLAVGQANSTNL